MQWSRHSRRAVPISRSQNAFASGTRTGVFNTRRCIDRNASSTAGENAASRSWTIHRYGSSPVSTLRNCCTVHSAVGCSLTFQCTIRRVPMSRTRNTYMHRNVAVTTTKKSHASISRAWFRTNVRHVCDEERGRDGTGRRMYRRTVRGETETPNFSNSSAAIRSSPRSDSLAPWWRSGPGGMEESEDGQGAATSNARTGGIPDGAIARACRVARR